MTKISLTASDGKIYELTEAELHLSRLLTNCYNDLSPTEPILVKNVDPEYFKLAVEFISCSVNPPSYDWVQLFTQKYYNSIPQLLLISQYLQIDEMTEVLSKEIAKYIEKQKNINEVFLFSNSR